MFTHALRLLLWYFVKLVSYLYNARVMLYMYYDPEIDGNVSQKSELY